MSTAAKQFVAYFVATAGNTHARATAATLLATYRKMEKSKTAVMTVAYAKAVLAAKLDDGTPFVVFPFAPAAPMANGSAAPSHYTTALNILTHGVGTAAARKRLNDAVACGQAADISEALEMKAHVAPRIAPTNDTQFVGRFVMANGQSVPLTPAQYKAIKALLELPEHAHAIL
jgi:hypothetical protein